MGWKKKKQHFLECRYTELDIDKVDRQIDEEDSIVQHSR